MRDMEMSTLETLRGPIEGDVILPDDPGYGQARTIWNGMIDRKPAAVVRPRNADDVAEAIAFARKNELPLAVCGGGHNVAGNAVVDDGVVIDFSDMRAIEIDPDEGTVRVEAGALLSDLDAALAEHGLLVPGGIVSTTGVAGLTLGGGFGWASRKLGLTIDSLRSAQVVTAEGELITASEESHPDLFWAIRGGGGNFGVVTSFEFATHELGPEFLCGLIVHPIDSAREFLQHHAEMAAKAPDELSAWVVMRLAPPLPFLPEEVHGLPAVVLAFAYMGDPAEGEALIEERYAEFGEPYGKNIGVMPYTNWQQGFDALNPAGDRNYWKSHNFAELSEPAIDTAIAAVGNLPSPHAEVFIAHLGGAISRVPADETAYAHRDAEFVVNIHGHWTDSADDEAGVAWARGLFDALAPHAQGGVYVNFLSDEGAERVQDAYSPAVWSRLVEVKGRYDPENVFRLNQNIPPG
ncbi:MAG: FAD-binding oxidoreductase [Thermoleophilia bacterium]|nr:FAD-binding oxidoreductase [Thermoleophilia bacterium]